MPKNRADTPENASGDSQKNIQTSSGIEIQASYNPRDLDGISDERDLGRPGEYPFTRGVYPTMYRGRLWTMRQFVDFGSASESNLR